MPAPDASLPPVGSETCLNQRTASVGTTLASLLEATSRGDRDAFRSLYDAAAPKLFGIVLRITRNRSIAEEVLQETFVRVWQNAELYSPAAGQPLSWLVAIARNKAIDRIRAEHAERYADNPDILERLPADAAGDPMTRESLRVCLSGLDEEARTCVLLAYCSGYSREELATRFSRPVGTIKTLLHRAIRLLRACLEKE